MNNPKDDAFKIRSFLRGLEEVISSLPKEGEKQRLEQSFSTLIDFLTQLRDHVQRLPSAEQLGNVSAAAQELRGWLNKLEQTPTLAAALGMKRAQKARSKGPAAATMDAAKGRFLLKDLEDLSAEEIRRKLSDEKYALTDLRTLAGEVGIASSEDWPGRSRSPSFDEGR